MPSQYVSSEEFPDYGIPDDTTDAQIRQASTLIDNFLDRQEGLVWAPDSFGQPCYMSALAPASALGAVMLSSAIVPGTSVVIAYLYPSYDLIGEVFIVDRLNAQLCEAVTVIGVDQINQTVTLAAVRRAHAAGATLEPGLTIVEERQMPARRSVTRVARPNLARLLSVVGRYGYGRRSDQMHGYRQELNLVASLQAVGGLNTWQPVDPTTCSTSPVTGEVWITPGLLMDYFNEARLRYVAGFAASAIPSAIKFAVATVIANQAASADLNPVFKVMAAGGTKIERFGSSVFDADTIAALSTHKLRVMV